MQLELKDRMDLASYLLKPVQRMGKYALILKQVSEKSEGDQLEMDRFFCIMHIIIFRLINCNMVCGGNIDLIL